jgi:hypothetical protein
MISQFMAEHDKKAGNAFLASTSSSSAATTSSSGSSSSSAFPRLVQTTKPSTDPSSIWKQLEQEDEANPRLKKRQKLDDKSEVKLPSSQQEGGSASSIPTVAAPRSKVARVSSFLVAVAALVCLVALVLHQFHVRVEITGL